MNRPGGNLTAVGLFTASSNALVAKRLQIIHELVPQAKNVGWLPDSNIGDYQDELDDVKAGARTLGLDIEVANVATDADMEPAIMSLVRHGVGAILEGGPIFTTNRARLVALALHYAVPWIFETRDFVTDGGLMSYGTDTSEAYRQAGAYAGRILRGERPGDLPVTRPTRFELFINLKTAKTLGLTIPPSLLVRADEVIE
jgi:putative ABC transport system substrate-binding protein